MLQAAKKITIQSKTFQSSNGFLLSPIININGLILRADLSMEQQKPIKEFLESKGAIVSRVKIENELYIRVCGGFFNLTIFEINEFIRENGALIKAQTQELEQVPLAINMQNSFVMQYDVLKEQKTDYKYTDGKQVLTMRPTHMISGQNTNIVCGNKIQMSTFVMIAGKDIKMSTKQLICSGAKFSFDYDAGDTAAGIIGICLAIKNVDCKFTESAQFVNNLVNAGNDMLINGDDQGNLQLEMDTAIEWLNNPYNQCLPMFNAKAKVCKLEKSDLLNIYEESEELDSNLENSANRSALLYR